MEIRQQKDIQCESFKFYLQLKNVTNVMSSFVPIYCIFVIPLCASLSDDMTTVAHSSASRSQRKLKRMQSFGGAARCISWQRGDFTSYCTERRSNSAINWVKMKELTGTWGGINVTMSRWGRRDDVTFSCKGLACVIFEWFFHRNTDCHLQISTQCTTNRVLNAMKVKCSTTIVTCHCGRDLF